MSMPVTPEPTRNQTTADELPAWGYDWAARKAADALREWCRAGRDQALRIRQGAAVLGEEG